MKNYFLGIGINLYESDEITRLHNAVKDVKDIQNILVSKYNFEILQQLINDEATKDNIYGALSEAQTQLSEDDTLLIYYAGHGFQRSDNKAGYWIPYDAGFNRLATYFPNMELVPYLRQIKAKHILVFVDSCFSLSLLLDSDKRSMSGYENYKSRWALTSGRFEVSDGERGTNSPFARAIIDYLSKQKKSFLISDLIQYVKLHVADQNDQNPQGYPISGVGHEGGEFIFKPLTERNLYTAGISKDEIKGYRDISKVLQLYEPKSQFKELGSVEDKTQKVGYSLFFRENKAINQVEYYLYLYDGINQTATLVSLKEKFPQIFQKKNLVILIPRDKLQKKQELRKKNIQEKFKPTNVFYIDEFIWDLCTPKSFTEETSDDKFLDINNFVKPKFQKENGEEINFEELIHWLTTPNKPVLVLKGSGGIGKTTIAKRISDIFQTLKDETGRQRKSLFIESTEIIDELKRTEKDNHNLNIYNFYEADCFKNNLVHEKLSNDLFKVNLDNGNILLLIDGLDEIISKVRGFDVNEFLYSIFNSYNEIGAGKVIITCREHFWDRSKFNNVFFVDTIELLPFDNTLAEHFFQKSFFNDVKKVNRCLKIAKEFVLRGNKEENNIELKYQPYVLDIIKNIVESNNDLLQNDLSFKSDLLVQDQKSDYIIYNVCRREIKRVGQIAVDHQILFFIKLSVNYDGVIAESYLKELINDAAGYTVDTINIEAIKAHPFIVVYQNKISFRYDFLNDFFKGIKLKLLLDIENEESITENIIRIIANNCWFNSGLIQEVVSRTKVWTENEILKLSDVIHSIDNNSDLSSSLKINAISGLFALALRINHSFKENNIRENTHLVEELFLEKENVITGLCIVNFTNYEKCIKFDFSNKILKKCHFNNYPDFWKCTFDSNTFFIECTLSNLHDELENSINITENQFVNCNKDGSVTEVFKYSDSKEKNKEIKVKDYMDVFFNLFFSKGRLERQGYERIIKRRFSCIRPNLFKLDDLLEVLEKNNVLTKITEQGELKIKIEENYKMDVVKFCKEGTMSIRINSLIKLLSERLN